MPLTAAACDNATCPQGKRHKRHPDGQGLYLEVLPNGGKYWRLKYRFGGKEKRLALGVYPAVSLAKARKARATARDQLELDIDPSAAKQERKLARQLAIGTTFEAVARDWYGHWSGPRSERHATYVLRRLEADVFPVIGSKPIAEVTAPQLLAMAKRIESRGALDIAKRSLQTCGQVFRYAVAHGVIERNPAADVKPGDALKPRKKQNYARLDARDLPELLRKIEGYEGTPYTRFALKLMAMRVRAHRRVEVDPISRTPHPHGRRSPRCPEPSPRMRRSSAGCRSRTALGKVVYEAAPGAWNYF